MNRAIRHSESPNLTDIDCLRNFSWKHSRLEEAKENISPELINEYKNIQNTWEQILDCYDTEKEILLARQGIESVKKYFKLSKGKSPFYKGDKNIRNTERMFKEILENYYLKWD
jgi:hypothetical protein